MLFHRKGNLMHGVAFDCGTSGVRLALFSYTKKDILTKPDVLEVMREPFLSSEYMDAHILQRRTQESIQILANKIPASFQPQEIIVGLSSPFYVSKTIRFSHERPDSYALITKEEMDEYLIQARDMFRAEAHTRVSGELVFFTELALKTSINGYPVGNAIGMAGKIIELSFRFEATTQDIYTMFIQRLSGILGSVAVHFTSISFANFYALLPLCSEDEGFILLDIGGEVSDISLSIGGVLQHSIPLPLGHNMFLREMAALLSTSLSDSSFIISRYTEGTLEHKTSQLIRPLVAEYQTSWQKKLLAALTVWTQQYELPSRIFLTGNVLPLHKELFSAEAFNPVFYGKKVSVELAASDIVSRHFGRHPFQGTNDFGLASLTLLGARSRV